MSENNHPFPDSTFKGFTFTQSDMTAAKFNGVYLSDAHFWAVLKNAQFKDCNLQSARFHDVNLSNSSFEDIDLSHSTFSNINMSGVTLSQLNLANVEITDANVEGMKINGVLVTELIGCYEQKRSRTD